MSTRTTTTTTTTRIRTSTPTRIEIVATRDGSVTRLTRLAGRGLLRARMLPADGDVARVALVQTAASLLTGDRVQIDVRCGPGARLRLVDVAAIVAHDVRGGDPAEMDVRLEVGARARLEWDAQPFVLVAGADVRRHTEVELRGGGAALLRDTLVLGRARELAGRLVTSTEVVRDGRPLHVESLDTGDVGLLRSPAVIGGAKVIDTLALYGARAEDAAAFQLAGPGSIRPTLARSLADAERGTGPVRAAWRAALLGQDAGATVSALPSVSSFRSGRSAALS
ncbi:MAG: urease accessory protein UreD [Solirubrobacteraceae bacterium]|nr:urease accessory protein UreD [Solirubrobacteraceae bacterium]